ncbi:60s acidic ribosomal protein-domain-containing protein [Lactarius quietus]|nr:60s acidic ribosomal protein-domain-containing protein [Lactarius quietus]
MRYIAAYLLLQIAGKESPTAGDITKVISSVGIEVDEDRVTSLLSELNGKDINTLIAEGSSKLASVPSGGGGAVSAAPASGGGAAAAAAETKEEEKKEEKEESDDDMGFGLFD